MRQLHYQEPLESSKGAVFPRVSTAPTGDQAVLNMVLVMDLADIVKAPVTVTAAPKKLVRPPTNNNVAMITNKNVKKNTKRSPLMKTRKNVTPSIEM